MVSIYANFNTIDVQILIAFLMLHSAWKADAEQCDARALTEAGWVCGVCAPGGNYASFLAVPYAEQPVAEFRFQDLRPPKPWQGCRDATKQGPICPQKDLFYGQLMRRSEMSEECIHANVYVPLRHLQGNARVGTHNGTLLPVLVQVHGGSFAFGSGDPDLHGPEYLVKENVVVVTFNYRLGPFGFLSLNSSSIPGNAGLRDILALLRWVQRNVKAFGGDPEQVTLSGQSAGASCIHLLTLSKAAVGLFKKVILMSGSGVRNFFTMSKAYAQFTARAFLNGLGISHDNPEEAHRQLITIPLKRIMAVYTNLLDTIGMTVFSPVVESEHSGVEAIVDDDPEILQAQGRGKNIPFLVGFTNAECETFRPRFQNIDIVGGIKENHKLVLSASVLYATPPEQLESKISKVSQRYFNGTLNLNNFLRLCSEYYFIYPILHLAEVRAAKGGAPVFMYQFAYEPDFSVFREAHKLKYRGAGHAEDLNFLFRANEFLGERILSPRDKAMTDAMLTYVTNFMRHSNPTNGHSWPAVRKESMEYQDIFSPDLNIAGLSESHRELMTFFNNIFNATN